MMVSTEQEEALRMLDDLNADGGIKYDDYTTLHDLVSTIQVAPSPRAAESVPSASKVEVTLEDGRSIEWELDNATALQMVEDLLQAFGPGEE